MPKTLISSEGQQKLIGIQKSRQKLKGDQAKYLLARLKTPQKPIAKQNGQKNRNNRDKANVVNKEREIQKRKTPTKHYNA